jgi:hypothetical protein
MIQPLIVSRPGFARSFTSLWLRGVPTRAMARQLNCSLATIWASRRRLGLPPRATTHSEARTHTAPKIVGYHDTVHTP